MTSDDILGQAGDSFLGLSEKSLLKSVLEHSKLVLWAVDKEGRFILSKGAGLREIGLEDDQVLGASIFEMYASNDPICLNVKVALDGQETHGIFDASDQSFETWTRPIRNAEGGVVGVVGISSLVTELSQTRKALEEVNERFRTTFSESPIPMAIIENRSGDEKIISVNQTFERVLRLDPGSCQGKSIREFTTEVFVRKHVPNRTSNPPRFIEVKGPDEQRRLLRITESNILYEQEDCRLLSCRDVTDDVASKLSQQRVVSLFENLALLAPVGIFQCHLDGTILFANPYFWNCFRHDPDLIQASFFGQNHLDEDANLSWFCLFAEMPQVLRREWISALDSGESFERRVIPRVTTEQIECLQIRIDRVDRDLCVGSIIDMTAIHRAESVSALRRRELEKAVQIRTEELANLNRKLTEEVSTRKQTAKELQQSQSLLQAILENVVDLICRVDRNGKVTYLNRTRFGFAKEDFIGTTIFDWLEGKSRDLMKEEFRRVIDHGEQFELEVPLAIPNVPGIVVTTRCGPIYDEDNVIGATFVATDVTEMRQLEATARQRRDELLHMSRLNLIGVTSSQLAHELRHPLLSIGLIAKGCTNYLSGEGMETSEIIKKLNLISEQSLEAREIIEKTKQFVRKRPLQKRKVLLSDIVESSLRLVEWEFRNLGIDVRVDLEKYDPQIQVDSIQIQQVLVNLLVNAREAIEHLDESERLVRIESSQHGIGNVSIRVTDSGPGLQIPANEAFEAFKTTKSEGSGMGLAICRGIIENHFGTLQLIPLETKGACFEIILPLKTKEPMTE